MSRDDLYLFDRHDVHVGAHGVPDGIEQQLASLGHAPTDDDPARSNRNTHVGRGDAQVKAGFRIDFLGNRIARQCGLEGLVRLGQRARVTLAYDPARVYVGRVSHVYPYLDADTRTLRVRFVFDNPGLALKPGMYADVELDAQAAEGGVVPSAAILDAGPRQIVYVQTGEGRYEPRQVTVGLRGDGQAQVLAGVKAGDVVVDRANFLLDSESRLRAAIARAPGAGTAGGGPR